MNYKQTLQENCKQLSKLRKSNIITLITPNEPLRVLHNIKIYNCIKGKNFEKIDVILHSGGGDIGVAYQLIDLMRNHCKEFNIIVPLYAKSAASLFVLASDKIIMGEFAEFGPLDSQIGELSEGEMKFTSALNPFKTLQQLQDFSLKTLFISVNTFKEKFDLSVGEALKHAIEFTSRIITPLISQINTEKLGEYSRALNVGNDYGERLLKRYSKYQNINDILTRFIYEYPSHDYIIDHKELKEIGFNVEAPQGNEKEIIDVIAEILINIENTTIFCVEYEENGLKSKNAKTSKEIKKYENSKNVESTTNNSQ